MESFDGSLGVLVLGDDIITVIMCGYFVENVPVSHLIILDMLERR